MADYISVKTDEVRKVANEIDKLNKQIDTDTTKVKTEVGNALASWKGNAGNKAKEMYNNVFQKFSNRTVIIENYVNLLKQEIGDGYDKTENTNRKYADKFK